MQDNSDITQSGIDSINREQGTGQDSGDVYEVRTSGNVQESHKATAPVNRKRLSFCVTLVACMGMLLSTLDTGIMNVALPFFTAHFNTNANIAALSVVVYTVSLAAVIMPLGSISDQVGNLKVALLGFTLFGISSLLCGFSVNIWMLIILRIFQGIGAAAMQATASSLITSYVESDELNRALGTLGIAIGVGPVLGPSVGGLFISFNAWRWIFWINVPLVLIAFVVNIWLLKVSDAPVRKVRSFDVKGAVACALTLIFLLSGLSMVAKPHLLWAGLVSLVLAVICLLILVRFERHAAKPLLHLHIYKESRIILDWFQTVTFGFGSSIIFLLPPFLLEQLLHVSAGQTGLYVLGAPVGLVIFSKISGNLNKDGAKNRRFTNFGLLVMALSFLALALTSRWWSPALVTAFLFLFGIGGGIFQPANTALIMRNSPQNIQSEAGALQRMAHNIGLATGTAIGSTILTLAFSLRMNIIVGWAFTCVLFLIMYVVGIVDKKTHGVDDL